MDTNYECLVKGKVENANVENKYKKLTGCIIYAMARK